MVGNYVKLESEGSKPMTFQDDLSTDPFHPQEVIVVVCWTSDHCVTGSNPRKCRFNH